MARINLNLKELRKGDFLTTSMAQGLTKVHGLKPKGGTSARPNNINPAYKHKIRAQAHTAQRKAITELRRQLAALFK